MSTVQPRHSAAPMPTRQYFCGSKKFQYFASGSASVGALGLGTVLAWSSPAIPKMAHDDPSNKYYVHLGSVSEKAWVASIPTLGALVSGPLAGFLMTKLGHKTAMLLMTSPFTLGWLLMTYSKTLTQMLIGRFLTGFCGGAISLLAPIFIGENVQPDRRGMLASFYQVMVVSGILFAYALGALLSWRWLSLACGLVPMFFIMFMIFLPESPRFFLTQGQPDDAAQSLAWLRGTDDKELVQDELKAIQKSVDETHQTPFSFREVISNRRIRKPLLLTTLMLVFQQLSGINTVLFYTSDLVDHASINISPDIVRIIMGSLQPFCTIASAFLVDRIGRRPLLMSSAIIMSFCHLILAIYFFLDHDNWGLIANIRWIPGTALVVLVLGFAFGVGGVPWVLTSELLNRRGLEWTSPIPTCAHWVTSFLVTMLFEVMRDVTDLQYVFLFHGFVCAFTVGYVYLKLPETKGRSLDEIQDLFLAWGA